MEQALAIDLQAYGETHPNVARDLNNMGLVWHARGDFAKAIDRFEQTLAIRRQPSGEHHPNVAIVLGLAWETRGDPTKAIDYFEQALFVAKKYWGDSHPSTIAIAERLGRARATDVESKKADD